MTDIVVRGQYVAPVTPFAENGDLMPDAFSAILRWHLDCGAAGFLVAGDNGEGWALTGAELGDVTRIAKKESAGRANVFVNCGGITARIATKQATIAAESGADGICLQPQSYVLRASISEAARRFELVSKSVPLPVMIYNNPARTGISLTPEMMVAICDVAPVVALKESSNDFFHITRVMELLGDRMAVLVGACHLILPGLGMGADGYLSTGPELWGPEARKIMGHASLSKEEKWRLHVAISHVFDTLMAVDTRPAGIKGALNMLGYPAGFPREPVERLSPEGEARIRDALTRFGLLVEASQRRAAS